MLAARGVPGALVLLTFFDAPVSPGALSNARATLRRLLAWRVVPSGK